MHFCITVLSTANCGKEADIVMLMLTQLSLAQNLKHEKMHTNSFLKNLVGLKMTIVLSTANCPVLAVDTALTPIIFVAFFFAGDAVVAALVEIGAVPEQEAVVRVR